MQTLTGSLILLVQYLNDAGPSSEFMINFELNNKVDGQKEEKEDQTGIE